MCRCNDFVIVFCSRYQEKFEFLKPEAPVKPCNGTQCDERRGKSHSAYVTVSDQVVNADLLPCTVINALLTLFWRLNRKKAICFTWISSLRISPVQMWAPAWAGGCRGHGDLRTGKVGLWEFKFKLFKLSREGENGSHESLVLWCSSCWQADLPNWQGEFATVNNWQVTTEYIVAITQKLTKPCYMAFMLGNVAVCSLTCKCVHSQLRAVPSLHLTEASLIVCSNEMKCWGKSVCSPSMSISPMEWLCSN